MLNNRIIENIFNNPICIKLIFYNKKNKNNLLVICNKNAIIFKIIPKKYENGGVMNKNKSICIIFKSSFLYTIIFAAFYFISQTILYNYGLIYLKWFQYVSFSIMALGIIIGTIQLIIGTNKEYAVRKTIYIFLLIVEIIIVLGSVFFVVIFVDKESVVLKNNNTMVEESHSFLFSNWKIYYDYENIFVRKNVVRIYEAHDDSLGEYLYTDYYDENGVFIKTEKEQH